MGIRIFITFVAALMSFGCFASSYRISAEEQTKMRDEAEDWIDDMPDGLQDRLSDAVNHAIQGMNSEIDYFRNYKDKSPATGYKVDVKDFQGGLNGNMPMRVYKAQKPASDKAMPLLVYFHGGGWSMGSLDTSDKFCRALADEGNVIVVSVAYPLAPEYPAPAAVTYCKAAMEYISSKAKDWGSDASLVSMGGDGAGGNIAVATYKSLKKKVRVKSLVLYYPLLQTNGELEYTLKRKYGRGYAFDSRVWEAFVDAYQDNSELNITDLPPTLLISAGRDIVIDKEKELARNKNVKYIEFTMALHGFITDGHQTTAFEKAVEFTDVFLTSSDFR
ncbi:MAG: alpha/beta hydrolase [Muribaculaceae bacterium]|nr:alpha/beta hydrolase [Muribaculaceae bacterium]